MAKITVTFNNFARAKIDHDMLGRFDLPIYGTGADVFLNWISNFKGNAIFRAGFEEMLPFQDCALVEFKFSPTQNYILVLYNLKMRFLSYDGLGNFGWVLNGGATPLEVDTPYTLAESKQIGIDKPAQNFDVMVITHNNHQPRKLIRTSANSFTFLPFSRKDDPFGLTYDPTKVITAITKATNALISVAAHGYVVGDMVKIAGVVGMTEINNYTARVVTVPTAGTFTVDIDSTNFTTYSSGGTTAKLLTGAYPAHALFYKGRLYYAATVPQPTTIWGSEAAFYDIFTIPTSVTDTSALKFTIADISQKIEWLFGGDNSLIAGAGDGIVAINGGGVGEAIKADTIEADITSADGCNSAYPFRKDGLVFYVGRNNRNVYYFQYDLITETFVAQDANFISYDITRGGFTKLRYKKDRNDLIFAIRGDGNLNSCNFNAKETIVGWHDASTTGEFKDECVITDQNGDPQLFVLALRNGVYYIERQAAYVEFKERSMFLSGFTKEAKQLDDVAYVRYVGEQLKGCNFLDNSSIISNLQLSTITYDSVAGTITAGVSSFDAGDVGKHISYRTLTGYESGRFEITAYISATVVEVIVLQEPTTDTYSEWYLTFDTISGLSQFNGQTIGVVVDGAYLDDYTVSGGEIELPAQACHAVVGYRYVGIIKSFSLGFQVQGANTQTTMKAVNGVGMRCVNSMGGKFGTSLYDMKPIQLLTPSDLNYVPTIPIDGTKYLDLTDDNQEDKYYYIMQDTPEPFTVTAAMVQAEYAISR